MKAKRQRKILEIINSRAVETQEELLNALSEEGFTVAQPTVSRDIQELRLIKASVSEGKYKYVQSGNDEARFSNLLLQTIISVDYAINMVVVKCHTGMAQAACAMIDSMDYPQILGTIAGDDTIFVVVSTNEIAQTIGAKIKTMMVDKN
jgi:transcriptional regulator of arginine metabolism